MKVKGVSLLVKMVLIILGFGFCVLHWLGKLPDATVRDIWVSISIAYGVGLGTVDFNICKDSWSGV